MLRLLFVFLLGLLAFAVIAVDDQEMINDMNRDPTDEKLEAIFSMLRQLKPQNSTSKQTEVRPVRIVQGPPACSGTWQSFPGMCLIFNKKLMTWTSAEKLCTSKGGYLAWIKNRTEHNIIRGFVHSYDHEGFFWIGLRRNKSGTIGWSNGLPGNYTGLPFTHTTAKAFAADSRDRQVDGKGATIKLRSVCRREKESQRPRTVSSDGGKGANINAYANMLKRLVVLLMTNEQKQFRKLTQIIQRANECPSPWIRVNKMCLLYIFQLRTWPDAEDLCTNQGGTLVWFENAAEHNFIRTLRWAPQKRVYRLFWIGLHKDTEGKLIWSGLSNSKYRGSPFTDTSANYFYVVRDTTQMDGASGSDTKFSAVCRRPIS